MSDSTVDALRARIAELEQMVVWAVSHSVYSDPIRREVIYEGLHTGRSVAHDGTPAGILAAVKEAMGDGVS